ncbi:cobalamin B12-binding domain-containing protein [Roseicella frigidaeris]|uniref:cobalamin B12-binding domain-containing protein n=1 Tax=Roseicella frigidaeris TaxID=2230885 RepID=UPI000FDEB8A8|nr:cobalamin-dependent protein [Roseicella frigidaeris]
MRALLATAVQAEVVPRLLLRQSGQSTGLDDPGEDEEALPGPEDVVALVALVMTSDAATALCFVDTLRLRGVTLERLHLELLAPAARRLGLLWVEDLCSFADVTLGLGRLQQVLRQLSPAFLPPTRRRDLRRRAALLSMPGEHHTFGPTMVTEFFLRAGWDVWSELCSTEDELIDLVGGQWLAVLGLSVSCDDGIDRLPKMIHRVRRSSRNEAIGIMVGGRVFNENPGLAAQVGADATAQDGRQAALQAETLLALLAERDIR